MRKYLLAGIFASAIATAALPSPAAAAVTIDILQGGSDVIATASGTFDLTGLIFTGVYGLDLGVRGSPGYIGLGAAGDVNGYSGLTGPTDFGSSTNIFYSVLNSGTSFALNAAFFGGPTFVFVPLDFVSGSAITASETFSGQTLASLGLTPGQYVFTSANDSVTINIGRTVGTVPEPATWAMMLIGFAAIGFRMRRRSKVRALQIA